jgi:hypothetical protein
LFDEADHGFLSLGLCRQHSVAKLPGRSGGEADGAGPEILLRIVALQPGADGVALAHVKHFARSNRARPQQQVHPGLRQLEPGLDLRQQRLPARDIDSSMRSYNDEQRII